jgi:glycosyltransferase involved in cell wall biosynthesis
MLRSLAARTVLQVICPVRPDQAASIEALRAAGLDVRGVEVAARSGWSEARRVISSIARNQPYVMFRRHAWKAVEHAWRTASAEADCCYFDHLDSFVYATALWGERRLPMALDMHNVYSLLAERTAAEEPSSVRRVFLRREAHLLAEVERRAVRACDAVFAVSDLEAAHFRALGAQAVYTAANGVDCDVYADLPTGRPSSFPTILFLATMSWRPNVSAALFLAKAVLPAVRSQIAHARLVLVGRNPPSELMALHGRDGVAVTGRVADVRPYLEEASMLAVPLDAGGGTRLKILEAFAAGLPVISTAVGAEGIAVAPGTHFVRVERDGFAEQTIQLLQNPDNAARMATAARNLVRERYDWRQIGRLAASVVEDIASSERGRS